MNHSLEYSTVSKFIQNYKNKFIYFMSFSPENPIQMNVLFSPDKIFMLSIINKIKNTNFDQNSVRL